MTTDLEKIKQREWFYSFKLPDGSTSKSYGNGELDAIHDTRRQMLDAVLAEHYPSGLAGKTSVDLACHQGYFSVHLANTGVESVLAIDARTVHIEDTQLISRVLELENINTLQSDVHLLDTDALGQHDIVLCFGLIYHLEDPIGALRKARALCKDVCIIETQVVPGMTGNVDWGSYRFVKPLHGVFGIIDETWETHGPEASITGICLAPSTDGLIWILQNIGFSRVELLTPPDGAYEQLKFGKRVMVAAYV